MNADRLRLENDRVSAMRFFREHYSREQRHLIIFERDFSNYLNSAAWLMSEDSRNNQKHFDFLVCFESLKEKMKEFRWSKEFLLANGIDFIRVRELYYKLLN